MTTNIEDRMTKCFSTVFPGLPESDIRSASTKSVKEWDSAAAITLVMVLEEEFEVSLDFEVMAEMDTFPKIAAYLSTL